MSEEAGYDPPTPQPSVLQAALSDGTNSRALSEAIGEGERDTPMLDAMSYSSTNQGTSTATPTHPARNSTPTHNGILLLENAPPTTTAPAPPPMPAKATPHGAPARRYLNEKVTGVLLEGMKRLAAEQPEQPLRVLGEFLLQRNQELEGV